MVDPGAVDDFEAVRPPQPKPVKRAAVRVSYLTPKLSGPYGRLAQVSFSIPVELCQSVGLCGVSLACKYSPSTGLYLVYHAELGEFRLSMPIGSSKMEMARRRQVLRLPAPPGVNPDTVSENVEHSVSGASLYIQLPRGWLGKVVVPERETGPKVGIPEREVVSKVDALAEESAPDPAPVKPRSKPRVSKEWVKDKRVRDSAVVSRRVVVREPKAPARRQSMRLGEPLTREPGEVYYRPLISRGEPLPMAGDPPPGQSALDRGAVPGGGLVREREW